MADTDLLAEFVDRARSGDRNGLALLLRAERLSRPTVPAFVEDVLGPLQRTLGDLCERQEVSHEQVVVASEVVVEALEELDADGRRAPGRGPLVVVACVPGEWHSLPATMVAAELRHAGCAVIDLGASVALSVLEARVQSHHPVAVALSATMPAVLSGARDAIAVAHGAGAPVLAGGSAFGDDGTRANRLDADAWAHQGVEAARIVRSWQGERPDVSRRDGRRRVVLTPDDRARLVDTALRTLRRTTAQGGRDTTPITAATHGLVAELLAVGEAAVVTGDDRLLDDALRRAGSGAGRPGSPVDPAAALDALVAAAEPGALRTSLLRARARRGTR